jgi:hypothetical protein
VDLLSCLPTVCRSQRHENICGRARLRDLA